MSKAGIGLAVAAVAVVGALGTSYYMGSRVQHGFEEFASTLQQGNKHLRVKIISYERGLFSSTAQTEWTLASRSAQWSFKANHRISHGPLPRGHAAEIDTDFLLNDDADPGLKTALAGKAPLSAHTVVNWNQSADGTLNSPAFTAQLKNATYDWGGMTAALSMGAHSTAIKGKAEFAGLGFTDPQQKGLQIKGGTMEMDLQQAKGHDFLVGPFKVALASMTMKGPLGGASAGDEEENDGDEADGADSAQAPAPAAEIETVALEGLSFDTNTVLAGDVVNLDMKTSIKTIDIPKYKVSDVALDFAMLNFDAAWLGQVQQLSRQGEGDLKELRAQLMQGLPQLLGRKPEFQIKRIAMRTEEGVSEVSGSLAYDGDASKPLNPAQDIKASLSLNLPKPVLQTLFSSRVRHKYQDTMEQLEQEVDEQRLSEAVQENVKERLDALLEAGLLQEKDNAYTASFSYAAGEMQANGKPLERDGLSTLMVSLP